MLSQAINQNVSIDIIKGKVLFKKLLPDGVSSIGDWRFQRILQNALKRANPHATSDVAGD